MNVGWEVDGDQAFADRPLGLQTATAARGALATLSANAQAGVNTMPTSEVTIA